MRCPVRCTVGGGRVGETEVRMSEQEVMPDIAEGPFLVGQYNLRQPIPPGHVSEGESSLGTPSV